MKNMTRALALIAIAIAVVVAGCGTRVAERPQEPNAPVPQSSPPAESKEPAVADPSPSGTPPSEAKPSEEQPEPGQPPSANHAPKGDAAPQTGKKAKPANPPNPRQAPRAAPPQRFQIERHGWRTAELSASALAARVDAAIAGMKGVGAETEVFVELPSATGRNRDTLRIGDRTRYAVPLTIVTNDVRRATLIADGTARVVVTDGQPASPRPIGALLPRWLDEFPRYVYAPLTDGVNAWARLSRELAAAGYAVRVERRDMPVRGKSRAFYRIVARKGDASIEVRFDGTRMLPVTIRVVKGPGEREKRLWTAKYSFGHRFAASDFVAPLSTSAPAVPNAQGS